MDQQTTEKSSILQRDIEHRDTTEEEQDGRNCLCCCSRRSISTVLSCTVIYSSFTLVNNWVITQEDAFNYTKEWGDIADREIRRAYSGVSSLTTLFAALLSLKIGYRIVAIIGCLMMMSSLFVASWLSKSSISLIGILVGGFAGIGASFVKLVSIVPVLENIQHCRFIAIAVVHIGGACADIVYYGLIASSWISDRLDLNWKTMYRWQLLVMTFALFASMRLRPSNEKWIQKYFSPFDWDVFKKKTLYVLMAILFCDRFGQYILSKEIFVFFDKNDNFATPYLGGFFYYGGQIFGPMFLFCCVKKEVVPTLRFMGIFDFVAGVWTVAATWSMHLFRISMYAGTLGIAKAAFATLLQNIIPTVFGKKNVRVVQGLFDFIAGVGILLSSPSKTAVEQCYNGDDQYKPVFYLSGSSLVVASVLVYLCLLYIRTSRPKEQIEPEQVIIENSHMK